MSVIFVRVLLFAFDCLLDLRVMVQRLCHCVYFFRSHYSFIVNKCPLSVKKKKKKKKKEVGFLGGLFRLAPFGQGWIASLPHGVFFAWLFCLWIMRMGFLRVVLLPGASFLGGHVPGCRILRAREELSTA